MIKKRLHRFTKQITQISILVAGYWLLVTPCYAQSISSTELINNAKQYDGKVVAYEGEVIGDMMIRGEYAWANINDGSNAIGIWLAKDLTNGISHTGSYKYRGDRIEAVGIFHRACLEHGGDLDIHATAIRKISEGRQRLEQVMPQKQQLTVIFLIVLCLILILQVLQNRRTKR